MTQIKNSDEDGWTLTDILTLNRQELAVMRVLKQKIFDDLEKIQFDKSNTALFKKILNKRFGF